MVPEPKEREAGVGGKQGGRSEWDPGGRNGWDPGRQEWVGPREVGVGGTQGGRSGWDSGRQGWVGPTEAGVEVKDIIGVGNIWDQGRKSAWCQERGRAWQRALRNATKNCAESNRTSDLY